jgi:hypothetical protein
VWLLKRRDNDEMAVRLTKFVASIAEFLSRFLLTSNTEEAILEKQRLMYRSDAQEKDSSEGDRI